MGQVAPSTTAAPIARRVTRRRPGLVRTARALACAAGFAGAVIVPAVAAGATDEETARFVDAGDGWFDVSGFLDTAYGFVPLLVPITEPAIGYGAAVALVFIDRPTAAPGASHVRPNIAAVGGLRTENGTEGLFAAHLGTWRDGRVRTIAALADLDMNLEFFGLGNDQASGQGLDYGLSGRGGVAGASYRLGQTQLWLGMRFVSVETDVTTDVAELPGASDADFGLHLAGLTPSITLDLRDNFFTPTRGWYVDLSLPVYREWIGSDRDFNTLMLTAMYFRPLGESLYLGVRATGKDSSEGTPFFLRPYVALRGVQALQFQGEQAFEIEAELRWQLHPRFSVLGFAGGGATRSDLAGGDRDDTVAAGGMGFRYLVARRYGLHMGIDVAAGPDDTAFYVVFGNAWLRP